MSDINDEQIQVPMNRWATVSIVLVYALSYAAVFASGVIAGRWL